MSLDLIFKISLAENVYFVSEGTDLGLNSGFFTLCAFLWVLLVTQKEKTGPVANSSCVIITLGSVLVLTDIKYYQFSHCLK